MTTEELHTLAHQIAYPTAKADIESFTTWVDDKVDMAIPDGCAFLDLGNRWYDLSTVITDDFERACVARAIFYLDARGLLHRKPGTPFLVQILPELSDGALVPPTLAEALSA